MTVLPKKLSSVFTVYEANNAVHFVPNDDIYNRRIVIICTLFVFLAWEFNEDYFSLVLKSNQLIKCIVICRLIILRPTQFACNLLKYSWRDTSSFWLLKALSKNSYQLYWGIYIFFFSSFLSRTHSFWEFWIKITITYCKTTTKWTIVVQKKTSRMNEHTIWK